MLRLSIDEILQHIETGTCFEAVSEDYAFTLKISSYVPFICGAVHDGHQFRKSLWDNCLHSEYDRWYEEDPCTKEMVQSFPIVLAGCDSRFEYDLNREPQTAIFDTAWGKQLWRTPLPGTEKEYSLKKHANFYSVVQALVRKIESEFGKAIVFDMHSYNWKRWDRPVPAWNLGTSNINMDRYGSLVESWRDKLDGIKLPNGIENQAKLNDTFYGKGYFLKYITENFGNTLVLATEISKIYCDESTGIIYPEVVRSVETQLKSLIPIMVEEFQSSRI